MANSEIRRKMQGILEILCLIRVDFRDSSALCQAPSPHVDCVGVRCNMRVGKFLIPSVGIKVAAWIHCNVLHLDRDVRVRAETVTSEQMRKEAWPGKRVKIVSTSELVC